MGLAERWPRFIALWNWCNVVQYLLLVVFSIPGLLGAPALFDQVAQLFALGWALWLEWFAFRLTLGIGVVPAAGLVATRRGDRRAVGGGQPAVWSGIVNSSIG